VNHGFPAYTTRAGGARVKYLAARGRRILLRLFSKGTGEGCKDVGLEMSNLESMQQLANSVMNNAEFGEQVKQDPKVPLRASVCNWVRRTVRRYGR
jgi:hypothetical protein